VRSAALFEPALGPDQELPAVPRALLAEFERAIARGEPETAAETFHRRLLSDAGWRRLSPEAKQRARALWRHIHADLVATAAWRVRAADLAGLELPVLLLRGGRSREAFEAPVRALCEALPRARRAVLPRASHQSFAAAWRELAEALAAFTGD
jgi:pimeloyl-ACP methyl ester carboxylesterase